MPRSDPIADLLELLALTVSAIVTQLYGHAYGPDKTRSSVAVGAENACSSERNGDENFALIPHNPLAEAAQVVSIIVSTNSPSKFNSSRRYLILVCIVRAFSNRANSSSLMSLKTMPSPGSLSSIRVR
jgi:hypothetical protein